MKTIVVSLTSCAKSAQSEERIGFGQDVLQNLQKYRNFDTYKDEIVQFGVLDGTIDTDERN